MAELESLSGPLNDYLHAQRESQSIQKTTFYSTGSKMKQSGRPTSEQERLENASNKSVICGIKNLSPQGSNAGRYDQPPPASNSVIKKNIEIAAEKFAIK